MDISNQDADFLKLYSDKDYEKPSVTVDAVIFRIINKEEGNYRKLPGKQLQVLLIKRQNPPFRDFYALPGTFLNLQNELSQTLKLCIKDKVGLKDYYFEQLFTFGEKSRDPRTRVLSVSYMLLTHSNENINGEWFDVNIEDKIILSEEKKSGFLRKKQVSLNLINQSQNVKLQNIINVSFEKESLEEKKTIEIHKTDLAFDHIKMIYYATERLKNKLEYTDIIFNLLPKKFSLTELKQVYEVILKEKLLDANFRRKIAKMVSPTNEFFTGKGFRSSRLYEHNPLWTFSNLD
jgi:8-oxo-dGTP diphosphatase